MSRLPLDFPQAARAGVPRRAEGQANGQTGQLPTSDKAGEFGAMMQQLSTPAGFERTALPAEAAPAELAPVSTANPTTAPAEPFLIACPPSMSSTVPQPALDMPRPLPRELALRHDLSGMLNAGLYGGGELSSATQLPAAGSFSKASAAVAQPVARGEAEPAGIQRAWPRLGAGKIMRDEAGRIAEAPTVPQSGVSLDADAPVEAMAAGPRAPELRPAPPAEPARSSVMQGQADALPDLLSAPAAYRMLNASVVSQETHFAPVRAATAESFGPLSRLASAGRAPANSHASVQGFAPLEPAALSDQVPAPAEAVRERALDTFAAPEGVRPARVTAQEDVKSPTAEAAPLIPTPTSLPRATVQALIGAIVLDVAEFSRSGASPTAPAGPASSAEPNLSGPMRVLSLQLHPAELGSVTVNLRLTGRSISTIIRASNPATAQLLQQERQQLADLLHHAGYVSELPAIEGLRADMAGSPLLAETARPSHQNSAAGAETFSSEKRQDGTGADSRSGGRDQERLFRQGRDGSDAPNSRSAGNDDQYV